VSGDEYSSGENTELATSFRSQTNEAAVLTEDRRRQYRVVILYRMLPQYRRDFYNALRAALAGSGIQLELIYGRLKNEDAKKGDQIELEWAKLCHVRSIRIGKRELLWQPCLRDAVRSDLVVVEQANRLLLNYVLMVLRKLGLVRLAFWGHGINRQLPAASVENRIKSLTIKQCDWWFAYTRGVKEVIEARGYPAERITVVQNAIDTKALQASAAAIDEAELENVRMGLNVHTSNVALFCGGMYAEKCLDFLVDACRQIRNSIPDFEMIFIGDGPEGYKVRAAASVNPWIHAVGPIFDRARIPYFKIAKMTLMPGLVGLAILDAFALECPLITTVYPYHSPEIDYLKNGINGIMTPHSVDAFAAACVRLFRGPQELDGLRRGCAASAREISLEVMVENFQQGIRNALGLSVHNRMAS